MPERQEEPEVVAARRARARVVAVRNLDRAQEQVEGSRAKDPEGVSSPHLLEVEEEGSPHLPVVGSSRRRLLAISPRLRDSPLRLRPSFPQDLTRTMTMTMGTTPAGMKPPAMTRTTGTEEKEAITVERAATTGERATARLAMTTDWSG